VKDGRGAFRFTGLDAWYYWVLDAEVLLTTSIFNAPEVSAARRANLGTGLRCITRVSVGEELRSRWQ
jgi:hypothetical protein